MLRYIRAAVLYARVAYRLHGIARENLHQRWLEGTANPHAPTHHLLVVHPGYGSPDTNARKYWQTFFILVQSIQTVIENGWLEAAVDRYRTALANKGANDPDHATPTIRIRRLHRIDSAVEVPITWANKPSRYQELRELIARHLNFE